MAKTQTYEFSYMDRREKLKLALLKMLCLGWTALAIVSLGTSEQ